MPASTTLTARSAALRETAKWIAAGFTGARAILFSGLVYTNIQSQAAAPYWGVLLALSVLPVVAGAWALREAAQIATLDPPDVSPYCPSLKRHALAKTQMSALPAIRQTSTCVPP